ncbi:ubiquitin-activating E1 FCCH domain-containing protein [Brevundimonas sp.]|uniref:ubiquitin-activating E1 FCCH domain-containing protein n=1 Tax=Brevundimonas sp. TaxID=1871086 RepID=UPI002D328E18|nr:ubiquitin-activating E1 FCCH domain-containing protein [Brevundimonas sp.]HYC75924.1 ubiquitin-activating E1 FCCH domain-containing protein [Brevundimonas sp.]
MGLKTWIDGAIGGACGLARRLGGDVRGNVAMLFGLSLPVLILMTFGGVDIHRLSTVRVNLQDALDAAALAAARSPYTEDADLQRVGLAALKANLQSYPNVTLEEDQTSFTLSDEDVVIADTRVQVKTLVANIFLPPYGQLMDDYLPVGGHSEVDRSSRNIEVALVLDLTGSMAGDRIAALIEAAKDLVDLVVQDVQTPYYSKVALVPYSNAVNPGSSYITQVRGGVTGSVNISNAVINLTGTQRTISSATRARPVVITTSTDHGFVNGDIVWITSSSGMTQLNNKPYVVTNRTARTFELWTMGGSRVDGRSYGSYSGNGRVQKCQNNDCSITITAANHGLLNNQYVRITDVNGMTQINNKTYIVGNVTTNSYTIDPDDGSTISPYSSGGRSWCAQAGCTWFAFENVYEDLVANRISSCVTERTGAQAWTEARPSGASSYVGRHYPDTTGGCLGNAVMPLTSDKGSLTTAIDNFEVEGTTAGHIGIGWGWYTLSPTFSSMWSSGTAAAYDTSETLKAMVIMTDGEFNTAYCDAVPDRNTGATSATYRNNCTANNGDAFTQARALCEAIKAQGILIYTVGFQIAATGQAASVLAYCASTPSNFHIAASAGDLSDAFAAIGRDITQLRISK